MAEPYLWGLMAVNVAWLALNTWHTVLNNRNADINLRQARETAALIEQARNIAGDALNKFWADAALSTQEGQEGE